LGHMVIDLDADLALGLVGVWVTVGSCCLLDVYT
jgi:hypothetical protein